MNGSITSLVYGYLNFFEPLLMGVKKWYHKSKRNPQLNKKNRKTFEADLKPVPSNVCWDDIEMLLVNLGAISLKAGALECESRWD